MNETEEFTIGVEEEYQIINPQTGELCGRAEQIIGYARKTLDKEVVQPEMYLSQVEIATVVCQSLSEVHRELANCRRAVIEAAKQDGNAIAAAGTHPFSDWQKQELTPKRRYQNLQAELKQTIRELVIFGNHVHVGLKDKAIALQVINRARIWLSVLLALSANSPFWLGQATGYASYRTQMWSRLPLSGQPQFFNDYQEYTTLIEELISTGAIKDPTTIYWDIRLSEKFPTIEFRVTDICMTVEEAVTMAGLIRALVYTCYQEVINDESLIAVRPEILKTAHWCAARYGLTEHLVDVLEKVTLPASDLVNQFLDYLRPALEKFGDWEKVSASVQHTLEQGNGAQRQLEIYEKTGSYQEVVKYIVSQTQQGIIS
ncbi:Carboxylate-amine ligase ybdK [Stanieria cyanosphaera PCC 7437]|uniref:Putative glutamate--cysteine ligase 2 n=1 Tax=Stanieria cyanosphaera (strain ATCC 29371 / PCC 7437) TaxID=111780 RepID=K9XWA7_STAC7|nr:carboxylate-amine ligase [Stanieria cyanosphaera]AFZ35952.1 Carboxylate-amine ligase ybdK [Stanieria cyanosphaera PCC 7437]